MRDSYFTGQPLRIGTTRQLLLDDCDPIHGAGVNLTVKWQGREDLSELRSRGVYIRFELTNMGLYSFALEG